MRFFYTLVIIIGAVLTPYLAHAQSNEEILSEAHALFHQASDEKDGKQAADLYRQTLLRYEQVYRNAPGSRLAYNIGNTYYRLGDLGRALVNYRRAEQDMAGEANLLHNLELVRSKRQDQISKQEQSLSLTSLNLHRNLPLGMRTQIMLAFYVAFWLSAGLFYGKKFPIPLWLPLALLIATLAASTSVGLDHLKPAAKEGVIVADEIVARQGDGRNFQPAFATPLHSATEFTLVKKQGYWLHIELADGRRCWIPARSAELI